MLKLGTGSLI